MTEKGWKAEVPAGAERPFQLRYLVTLSAPASSDDGTGFTAKGVVRDFRSGPQLPSRKLAMVPTASVSIATTSSGPHVAEYARHGLEFSVMRGPVNLGHAVAY
jgi:hypothetical protein